MLNAQEKCFTRRRAEETDEANRVSSEPQENASDGNEPQEGKEDDLALNISQGSGAASRWEDNFEYQAWPTYGVSSPHTWVVPAFFNKMLKGTLAFKQFPRSELFPVQHIPWFAF